MATLAILIATRRSSSLRSIAGSANPSWSASPSNHKWASMLRPFSSEPTRNDVTGIDLGTTDSCVAVMEGKNVGSANPSWSASPSSHKLGSMLRPFSSKLDGNDVMGTPQGQALRTNLSFVQNDVMGTPQGQALKNNLWDYPLSFSKAAGNDPQGQALKKKLSLVHVLFRNKKKIFVTVTDAIGNKKMGASTGSLRERKGRSRVSRYAAEATAEHVGRSVRKMGLKSVVMKVKGYQFFRKKKKVILSWREGFLGEGVGVGTQRGPIMCIKDVTQLPHNGCRLPKKRRV